MQAVGVLGGFDDESARGVVLVAARDRDPQVRLQALHALSWKPAPGRFAAVREAIAPALKDDNGIIRATAVLTLGSYGMRIGADVPEVFPALADPDPYVRRMACTVLPSRPASRQAIPSLIRALGDTAMEVRYASADRLGGIGLDAEEALPALRRAAEDKEDTVRKSAGEAVRSIESKVSDFRTKLLPGALDDLSSPDPEVRRGAAEVLASFGPRASPAVPALIRTLADREATVRLASARALGQIGPAARDASSGLIVLRADPDERVRRAAEAAEAAVRSRSVGP
jgi:HEAT repeat protein